uniref:Uncharacterized protein n=1 Tax=Marseillevirus LCMAC103 TaxID=2506604 RepID=A0A481YU48_9VIRU|nr:MAG: hypothetical protein LCMAC103_00570 [Marseillevirus LCMAC103]
MAVCIVYTGFHSIGTPEYMRVYFPYKAARKYAEKTRLARIVQLGLIGSKKRIPPPIFVVAANSRHPCESPLTCLMSDDEDGAHNYARSQVDRKRYLTPYVYKFTEYGVPPSVVTAYL